MQQYSKFSWIFYNILLQYVQDHENLLSLKQLYFSAANYYNFDGQQVSSEGLE